MKKIPTIFKRNPERMRDLLDEPHPDCLWVFNGEGKATRKYDGTCVMIENGVYFKRREVKEGKIAPLDFVEIFFDPNTGKRVGWIPVHHDKENRYHLEAFKGHLKNGTYELLGPKIQGNPENANNHLLLKHSDASVYEILDRTFSGIKNFLESLSMPIEGIVFHHPDGRMAKIKMKDFGLKREKTFIKIN